LQSTRREFVLGATALAVCPPLRLAAAVNNSHENLELWYERPATQWMEALPIGNGRIGGMVYGGEVNMRIDLTESTVWSGATSESNVNPTAIEMLPHIRQLMFDGNYAKGGELCKEHFLGRPNSFGTHLPMASLVMTLDPESETTQYRRSLRLDDAVASVDYVHDGVQICHEAFSSNPANVLVVRVASKKPKSIHGSVSIANLALPGRIAIEGNNTLVLDGNAFEHLHSDGTQGVRFITRIRVLTDHGDISVHEDAIRVEHASTITLLIAIATNFRNADPSAETRGTLKALNGLSYAELRAAHIADHQSLFHRVSIDLGGGTSLNRKPTDQRLMALRAGGPDP
jgi:alpha-L-fucosidase 2